MKIALKFVISFLFIATLVASAIAQHGHLQGLYLQDKYIINPAAAGLKGTGYVFLDFRDQWAEGPIINAPESSVFGLHRPFDENNSLGFILNSYSAGLQRDISFSFTYAYRLKLGANSGLSFGVSGGLQNFDYAINEVSALDMADATMALDEYRSIDLAAAAGIKYYNEGFELDFAAPQLFNRGYELNKQFIGMASYAFDLGEPNGLVLEPSVLARIPLYSDVQVDFNLVADWKEHWWLGAGYRMTGAYCFMGGVRAQNIDIGYTYQVNIGPTRSFDQNTMEFYVAYHFIKSDKPSVAQIAQLERRDSMLRAEEAEKMLALVTVSESYGDRIAKLKEKIKELNLVEKSDGHFNDGTLSLDPNISPKGNYVVLHNFKSWDTVKETVEMMRANNMKGQVIYNKTKDMYYIYSSFYEELPLAIDEMKYQRKLGFKAWVLVY